MSGLFSVFVFGLIPESSGKTTVCMAVARGLRLRGWNVGAFKPRSGHSYWYHHDIYVKCRGEGRLYSWDILRLSHACEYVLFPLEVLNPVDALFSPPDRLTLDPHLVEVHFANPFFELVAERYTLLNDTPQVTICLNGVNLETDNLLFKDWSYIEELKRKAGRVIVVESLEEWNEVYSRYAPLAIRSCYGAVCRRSDVVVVEGFNDAVCPDPELSFDLALGVSPGAVFMYDGERLRTAVEAAATSSRDPRNLEARSVIDLLKPEAAIKTPVLTSRDVADSDKLALKLGELVDKVEEKMKQIAI
ncbi:MAG: hypothetical protein QXN15_11515 [Candidatus Jordarchaeales archaeon]|nr:hypothetical protein [Candidatus Jordarchaeia archaeon]